jgi:hypothetical protein
MGRGQLVFKGEATKKAKKKVKHDRKQDANAVGESVVKNPLPKYEPDQDVAKAKSSSSVTSPSIEDGIGQITSSGTVIMGHGTSFMNTLSVGDAILVQIDENQSPEMRVITMCLSNTSINLSSSFSRSLTTPTSFQYIRKPNGQSRAAKTKLEQDDHERASGFQGSNVLVYRESTETGSYRIKKETVAGDVSRTHMLEMRAKKKSDKYC